MSLIKPKAPRWYREQNGVVEACYQLPKKSGDGMKDTTLREARELGLLPSVTTVLRVMAQPGLERYKLGQVIYSAMTLPRIEGEGEDAFARRVVEDSEAQAAKAAEFGTRIHDAISEYLRPNVDFRAGSYDPDPALVPYLKSFADWANDNLEEVHAVEKVVGGKHCGYAGRLDLDCTLRGVGRAIIDIKTQGIKEYKEPTYYQDWPLQLAAYAGARDETRDRPVKMVSVVIDSRAPGPIWPKIWEESLGTYYGRFEECLSLWSYLNDYDPCQPVFDPTAGVKQAREDYALKQMGILPVKELE